MNLPNIQSRRKILLWALSITATIPVLRLALPRRKKKMVKLLTQDGKLVEVEVENLPSKRRKIGNDEFRSWVKK